MSMSEQEAMTMVTSGMIDQAGMNITIYRDAMSYVTSSSGGQVPSTTQEEVFVGRFFFQHVAADDLQAANQEGDQDLVWALLIGPPGISLQKGDQFYGPDNLPYRVRFIHKPSSAFETRAECYAVV